MSKQPRVFVVNEPMRWDNTQKCMVRARDISPAHEFGELVFVLPAGEPPLDPETNIQRMTEVLDSFTADDYLLPIGHPLLIVWASAIAARKAGGKVKTLHWQSKLLKYAVVTAVLWPSAT